MRLFLKDHRQLIIIQIIQIVVIISLLLLEGSANVTIILYSLFISSFIFIYYLTYRYISHRQFYKRLSRPLSALEESLQYLENTPLATSLNRLLTAQYQQYKQQILETKHRQEEHMIFVDRWVHQMKTPLSVLQLMAQDLDEPASSSFREELERMKTGLQMALYMARLRTIEQDFHIEKVSLLTIIQEINRENKRTFIRSNVYPNIIEKKEGLLVETDEKWLFFLITQLIHNAVKYSAGHANKINMIVDERKGRPLFEIEDFGIGIPKEDVKRLFDLFYTGENGRKYRESTGVGLFLVKEVADYLNHTVEVESTVGKGTKLRIIF